MKNLIYLLIAVLAVTTISCGDDEPVIPRDRDIVFSPFELFHIDGTTPSASLQQCDITIHRKEVTADLVIRIALNGSNVETFNLSGIPLTYDDEKNVYTAHVATTNQARITDLTLALDCNDYIASMSFKVDDKQVTGTSDNIFYGKATTTIAYRDSAVYAYPHTRYLASLRPNGMSASLNFGELLIKYENLMYSNITVDGLNMEVTSNGYHLTGNQIETEEGKYYGYDFNTSGSNTTDLGDQLFLRFDDLVADVNVKNNSLQGSWTMVRLKRVTDTIQKTPELKVETHIVEVSKTNMTVQGTVY